MIKWSIEVIRENSEEDKYGYYAQLHNLNSETHKTIDEELLRFLKEEHHMVVRED